MFRFDSAARGKGELLRRQRLLEQEYAHVHRQLVHLLTAQAAARERPEKLRQGVRDLEARMIAVERDLDEVRAELMADVTAMRRAQRSALWRA